jgi:large subunit ribosomal protein L2
MKAHKPTTPGRRGMTNISYKDVLTAKKPLKSLTKGFKRGVGRNNAGKITTRHKGGGVKRLYRDIDFKYDKRDIPAKIETIEYDPNRSAFIGVALYADGERRYIIVSGTTQVGDTFTVSDNDEVKTRLGNRQPVGKMSVGTMVYNVEVKPDGGAKLARSAGNYIEIIAHDAGYTHIKMPSSEVRKVLSGCWATVGEVSNSEHRLTTLGKAGRKRHMGIRPTVRGSAMNAVDHPYGGGEGKAGRGRRRSVSKWGKPTGKGQKSRTPKKYSNKLIVKRRNVGKR